MTVHDADLMRRVELERADAARRALDEAALALEVKHGAEQYMRAWRKAAGFLRTFKPQAW
jgi:hypothetical protein